MKRILPLLLAVAALSARAAVPADFAKTFTVTVPAGLVDAGETLTSFPLLLRLGTGISGFDYDDFQQAGADILVTDSNGNALPYELENWDTAGESRLWVRVPSVAAGTTLTVYYGSAETIAPPAGMWSGYAGVWHLNEAGDGATTIADSTADFRAPTLSITDFDPATGVVKARVTPGTGNTIEGSLVKGVVRLRGGDEPGTLTNIASTAFTVNDNGYLAPATKGEFRVDAELDLGPAAFFRIAIVPADE